MPVIEEVDESTTTTGANSGAQTNSRQTAPSSGMTSFMNYVSANKIETAQWVSRMFTVFCAVMYIFPIYGQAVAHGFYTRALISHGLTSALRLHQRLPQFQFSREYMALLLNEDSCHNLFYSLMFANSYPVTMVLTPVLLYAVLHSSNFSRKAINMIGSGLLGPIKFVTDKVISNQVQILRFIAMNEIVLLPFLLFMVFSGRVSLLLPFVYIRFLIFRYSSRRNPYCRQLFAEMRIVTENYCSRDTTPAFLKNLLRKGIALVSRFAPPPQQAAT